MAKQSLEKKSLLILRQFLTVAGIALLFIVGYSVYRLHSDRDVMGVSTKSAEPTFVRFPVLSCNQCLKEGQHGKTFSFCFHNNGKNSYADCQLGTKTSKGTVTCVTCGTAPTSSTKPSLSPRPTESFHSSSSSASSR